MSIDHSSNMVGYSSIFPETQIGPQPPPSRNANFNQPCFGDLREPQRQERDKLRMQTTQSSDKIVVILWYLICIHHHHISSSSSSSSSSKIQQIHIQQFSRSSRHLGTSRIGSPFEVVPWSPQHSIDRTRATARPKRPNIPWGAGQSAPRKLANKSCFFLNPGSWSWKYATIKCHHRIESWKYVWKMSSAGFSYWKYLS